MTLKLAKLLAHDALVRHAYRITMAMCALMTIVATLVLA